MIAAIGWAIAAFVSFFALYFTVLKMCKRGSHFFRDGLGFWLWSVPLLCLAPLPFGSLMTLLAVYTGLWVLALNVMAAIANSVTLFLLEQLVREQARAFTETSIIEKYDPRRAFRGRLSAIEQTGLVQSNPQAFLLTWKGALLVAPFLWTKYLFGIRRVG